MIVIIDEVTSCCKIVILNSTGKAYDDQQLVKEKFGFYKLTGYTKNDRSVYHHIDKNSDFLFFDDKWVVSIRFRITLKKGTCIYTQALLITLLMS